MAKTVKSEETGEPDETNAGAEHDRSNRSEECHTWVIRDIETKATFYNGEYDVIGESEGMPALRKRGTDYHIKVVDGLCKLCSTA